MTKKPLAIAIAAAIRRVPRGRVSTYGAVAKAAGYPRCARHVAGVLRQVQGLPWQRIVGSGGRISLRGEAALEQRFLLEAEGVRFFAAGRSICGSSNTASPMPSGRKTALKAGKAAPEARVPAPKRLRRKL